MEISYRYFNNPDQEEYAREQIDSVKHLFPIWLRLVYIEALGHPGDDAVLSVNMKEEYRSGSISLYPAFFDQSEEDRHRMLLHEIVHLYHVNVSEWVKKVLISPLKESNSDLHDARSEEFREREERFTQDMAFLLKEIIDG